MIRRTRFFRSRNAVVALKQQGDKGRREDLEQEAGTPWWH